MERKYNEIKKIILDMAESEIKNEKNRKNMRRYCESNFDKIIYEVLDKDDLDNEIVYLKIIKKASEKEKLSLVIRFLKSQSLLRKKSQIIEFANYLNIDFKSSYSYNQMIVKVAKHIYKNKNIYSNKFIYYKKNNKEYLLETEKVKNELIKSYKSKTKNDILSIAKLIGVEVCEDDNLEQIRKRLINHIIKEKLKK